MSYFTSLLQLVRRGDNKAAEELLPVVYAELRKLAAIKMANEMPGQMLQATELVHEAWLRMVGGGAQTWENRAHFFGAAAEAMRRILIENARRRRARKHGGGLKPLNIEEVEIIAAALDDELFEIHEVLDKFAAAEPEKAELVKLRYFVGLSFEEAAEVLGISIPTAKRWWADSRAWLFREIQQTKPQFHPQQAPSGSHEIKYKTI